MTERKINLEEILQDYYLITLDNRKEIHAPIEDVKSAIIEFGEQLLELATENVNAYIGYSADDPIVMVDKQSILDTIKQVE